MKRSMKLLLVIATMFTFILGISALAIAGEKKEGKRKYRSSIQVPNDEKKDEKGEAKEKEGEKESDDDEAAEEAQLQSLAKITKQQAIDAALEKVPGKLVKASLDNEDGNLVYSVEIKTASGVADVKVDAGNAKVLYIDRD